jgi:hypothetical protein
VLNLYLQCYTQEEIAEAVFGVNDETTKKRVSRIWDEIRKYEICPIPGQFSEDLPEDSAPEKVKREAEAARLEKIIAENTSNAEHASGPGVAVAPRGGEDERSSDRGVHRGQSADGGKVPGGTGID